MIITCPNCATGFKVSEAIFADGPRKVRCAACSHSWIQEPSNPENETDDPLDDILSDSQWNSPQEDTDENDTDFDVEMPAFERSADEEDQVQENQDLNESPLENATDDDTNLDKNEDAALPHDIESEAKQDTKSNKAPSDPGGTRLGKWKAPIGIAASLALTILSMVYFRTAISSYIPTLGPLYSTIGLPVNLLGIEFSGVRLKQKYENGFPVLSVEGEVINVSGHQAQVPDVRLSLQSSGGTEIYHWSINIGRTALEPDQRVKFVTRLASPPEEAKKIIIRFNTTKRRMGAL